MAERYNGWTNYETWCVNLWIDNEESAQEYWRERAADCLSNTDSDLDAISALCNEMEYVATEECPEIKGFHGDLLRAALSEVNWHEIARHYIEAVKEESNA
jgi:hypothetical protein